MRRRANTGTWHCVEVRSERRQPVQYGRVMIGLLAPRDFVFDRNRGDRGAGGGLFTRMQHAIAARMVQINFTFDDRNARTLRTVVDGEDCAQDRKSTRLNS